MKAIVLANGPFPCRDELRKALLRVPTLVCCDGAFRRLVDDSLFEHAATLPAIYVVGDGDSLPAALRDKPPLPATFVGKDSDQETNDLTKAVRFALGLGVKQMLIMGATGLREDHTLGNIGLLPLYAGLKTAQGEPLYVRMYTDFGFFTPLRASATLPSFAGQQVSFFVLQGSPLLTVRGLKYPINRRRFTQLWEATLNEALGPAFDIELEGEGCVLVYQTHDAK
ncbi:MAG: thiamine diphosphokinase [Bacteroidales bacterium]|nr:thiamine diphosphokinase [Bacteroidales bacterium]